MQGVLRVGDEIEVRPGIVTKDSEGNVRVSEPLPVAVAVVVGWLVGWLIGGFSLFDTAALSLSLPRRGPFHFRFLFVFSVGPFFLVLFCFVLLCFVSVLSDPIRFVSFLFCM